MTDNNIPFRLIDWNTIEQVEQRGTTGSSYSRSLLYPGLRIRMVTYSAGYLADHWCHKGHIVHCLDGELVTEHEEGKRYVLKKGMTYVVSDDLSSHRSLVERRVQLLIIDGDFLARTNDTGRD